MTWVQILGFAALFAVPMAAAIYCQIKYPDRYRTDTDPYDMI